LQSIFVKSQNPATFVEAMINLTDSCFTSITAAKPTYNLRALFTGIQALQPGPMRGLVLTRQQDVTAIHDLLRSNIPVFHLYGTNDRLVNGVVMDEELRKLSPAREVAVVQGGGHLLFWEHPDIVASRLIDFSRKVSSKVRSPSGYVFAIHQSALSSESEGDRCRML
jgi:pimeloyl-ACP methyl ester carboxylesterase